MAFAGGFPRDEDTASIGGGVLLAVGLVVAFFGWGSWWTAAGLALAVAGAVWLVVANRDA
ncbi:hypothetical protein M8542_12505 [Amycolatopsis sp. OK19-0408]|uniref:Uncharacterized protein n=1 Tax=Amycolatopsis iheyensis TaxID=2945988 RepID=A0A9X2SIQ9_9PSEU|nr:hypothetical protein [Amycolatopsis iheyensis]MCR6483639.1 hypothetical protein [Amycolatopsis iheyensis]